jgi:hypothetical protein
MEYFKMCKISIISNFRFKWDILMPAKQALRVNFLALFLLISGLTGLIGSGQAIAFHRVEKSKSKLPELMEDISEVRAIIENTDVEMCDVSRLDRATSTKGSGTTDGLASRISRMSVEPAKAVEAEQVDILHLAPMDPRTAEACFIARQHGVITGTATGLSLIRERIVRAPIPARFMVGRLDPIDDTTVASVASTVGLVVPVAVKSVIQRARVMSL